MNPNKFHAIRALHVFRNVVEELATNCASPLMNTDQREVGLFLLELTADVAHAAYALYHEPDSAVRREEFVDALQIAEHLFSKHTTEGAEPFQVLLSNLTTLTQDPAAGDVGAGVIPESSAAPSVEVTAWRALEMLLQDVDQTVAYGLAADVEPACLLLLYVGLQLPAALARCAFEVLEGLEDDNFEAAEAIQNYNTLRMDAYRIRSNIELPVTVRDYPVMPSVNP